MTGPEAGPGGDSSPGPPLRIVVCQGDETGQELLDAALPVLDEDVSGVRTSIELFDLSLANRRETANRVVTDAAAAMRSAGLGLKAATITPVGHDDVGSPNRILREAVGGTVVLRTGRRIPGVAPYAPVSHPVCVARMAVGDAYGAREQRIGEAGGGREVAERTERISRDVCRAVTEYAFRTASELGGCVFGGPKWTVSPLYEGMLKEEMDAASARHPGVPYRPVLIDATYADLITGARDLPLVIPALNRDGDCLSDLVLAMFGSIAGAESVLIALDDQLEPTVAMAEAPHGTAPSLQGKNVANPMAMLLAIAAVLDQAARRGSQVAGPAGAAIRAAVLDAAAEGIRTVDLGGTATTTEVVAEVIARARARTGS
jgi:isocitrate/isopropylmalate dehydrogenase